MAKLKFKEVKSTVTDAVSTAFSELSALAEEVREIVENASGTGLENTQRIQTLSETADTLENYTDEPDYGSAGDLPVSFQEWIPARRGRALSRADRCAWACSILETVVDVLDIVQDEKSKSGESGEYKDDIDAIRQACEDAKNECESLDFPGMYG